MTAWELIIELAHECEPDNELVARTDDGKEFRIDGVYIDRFYGLPYISVEED